MLLWITQLDLCAKGLWLLQRSVPQHWIITELAECSALRRSQMSTTSVQTGIKKKRKNWAKCAIVAEGREGKGRQGKARSNGDNYTDGSPEGQKANKLAATLSCCFNTPSNCEAL